MNRSEVLLIEDCAGDALLVGQALAECPVPVHLHIARDGEQALNILEQRDFKPDLIILDLNIPKISGYTVLSLFSPKKNKTPVVVFSASENEADVSRALSLGAREFVHKPIDLDEYKTVVSGMVQKWGQRMESPLFNGDCPVLLTFPNRRLLNRTASKNINSTTERFSNRPGESEARS